MNLSDLIPQYSLPTDDYSVDLVSPAGEPTTVTFRRIRSAAEMVEIKKAAMAWIENARVLAPTDEDRRAIGDLAGDTGKECMVWACIMAASVRDDTGKSLNDLRYIFCQLAANAGPTFELLRAGMIVSMVSDSFLQMEDAEAGKAGCGQTPPCEQDCECAAMSGASIPTN